MAIVRVNSSGEGGSLERRVGLKVPGKKAALKKGAKRGSKKGAKHPDKHAAKKHAEKHPGKKAAKKSAEHSDVPDIAHARKDREDVDETALLTQAFHHLQRASGVISLLEPHSGGDLRQLLEHGLELYRAAAAAHPGSVDRDVVQCALGLLRAAEHLAMAGLLGARSAYRIQIAAPDPEEVSRALAALVPRVEALRPPEKAQAQRLHGLAREMLRRARQTDGSDPHLDYELTMAAEGLCIALEQGL